MVFLHDGGGVVHGSDHDLMRVHLLTTPVCQTTRANSLDGFNMRTILFAEVLRRLGIHTILYGSEPSQNEAPCVDFVSCLSEAEQQQHLAGQAYQRYPYDGGNSLFALFNQRAGPHVRDCKQPGDILATICGTAQQQVWEHNPELICLEYSIGYRGVFAPYRVYQSHAWRHMVMGWTGVNGGRDFDTVIPPFYETERFPFEGKPDDYVLFCGRLELGKGIKTACDAAKAAGVRLVVVGHGDEKLVTYGDYVGAVSDEERNRLMAGARAVLMPTQYVEPFGNVCAEAQLCGTPVISTDYGAFTESVAHGLSGYRCNYLGEFVRAIDAVQGLDRAWIRARAQRLWSMETAAERYRGYFARLALVRDQAWQTSQTPALALV